MKEYYRPLLDCLTIDEAKWLTDITGKKQLGLFATEIIYQDTNLGISHYFDERGEDNLIRTPLGGFFNHTETPNCHLVEVDGIYYLTTIKEIYPNEELTVLYKAYDPTK